MSFRMSFSSVGLMLAMTSFVDASDLNLDPGPTGRQRAQVLARKDRNVGRYIPNIQFEDVAGMRHQLIDHSSRTGLVIAATSTSCPLSKKNFPTLIRLAREYHQKGIDVILVNPISTDDRNDVQKASVELGKHGVYVHDRECAMIRELGLTTTTDVILIDSARTVKYQGAVDDQYGFGYQLAAPRRRFLISAIEEFLNGHPVAIAATEAPGCDLDVDASAPRNVEITYHNRISRIVQAHCGECHRDQGVAPFSLQTHAEVVAHAPMIQTVINRGSMPPWFASPARDQKSSPWLNDCSLSDIDKRDFLEWLRSERPIGDAKDAPLPVRYPDGWTIGKPDLIVKFPKAEPIQATGFMEYKTVVVKAPLDENKWVQSIEVRPGAPQVIHHVLVFVQAPGDASNRMATPGDEINYWGIYVPGSGKQIYPKGLARMLPKGAEIQFQMHYTPNGTATEDLTQVGFVFADGPPENEVKTTSLVNAWFEIPPGDENYQDFAKMTLPFDATVLGFLPHMHLRGKSCRYEVIAADGTREVLLDIPHYDFNWQLFYRYREPRTFAKQTMLKFTAAFDNSRKNPANPDPTASVRWGQQTFEEMIVGYVEYCVPVRAHGQNSEKDDQRSLELTVNEPNEFELIFGKLDTNDDNQLTLKEFKLINSIPMVTKMSNEIINELFAALDQDGNGNLNGLEFQKLPEMR